MISKTRHTTLFAFATLVIAVLLGAPGILAQTSAFIYQGRLTDGGTPANGNYDLQLALWNSLSGGTQVGSSQTINTVVVSNGVFTVTLDFGANAFPGASRFLEISARPSGSGSFTLLTPRQPIASTPYAVRSLNAATADSVPASGVSAGSGNYIQNTASPQLSSNFNITGNGTAGGTLSGSTVNATTQYNLNGSRILSASGSRLFAGVGAGAVDTGTIDTFNTFVGTNAGTASTTGFANAFFGFKAGSSNTTGSDNSFFGNLAGPSNTTGSRNTLFGSFADVGGNLTNATAIGANARVDASNALVLGSINGINGATADTSVGIGTTAPFAKLSVIAKGDGARVLHLGTERGWVFLQRGTGAETFLELSGENLANNNKNFVINTTGNVGIGTNAPTATLSVNGTANKPGGGSWAAFSDERLKNIKGRFTSGLEAVMQLEPLRYEYKRDNALNLKSEGEHVGFSAQAVRQIIPEAVTSTEQGYLLVDNDPILWTMLNAIKEQQAQIEQQQQQIAVLTRLLCQRSPRAEVCKRKGVAR